MGFFGKESNAGMFRVLALFSLLASCVQSHLVGSVPGLIGASRLAHRRTVDGRLCSQAFVHEELTHTDCVAAAAPDGTHGGEWCYVAEQVSDVGRAWDHCAPRVDYPQLREACGTPSKPKLMN